MSFDFRGLEYHLTVSRYDDGRLAEVFIACPTRSTSPSAADARDAAVLISVACQYGADPRSLRHAITRQDEYVLGRLQETPAGIGGAILDTIVDKLDGFGPEQSELPGPVAIAMSTK